MPCCLLEPPFPKEDRWQHLVTGAFRLDEAISQGVAPGPAMLELLDSALEVFTPGLDPLEDFEGYAVRRLLLSLREASVKDGSAR